MLLAWLFQCLRKYPLKPLCMPSLMHGDVLDEKTIETADTDMSKMMFKLYED